MSEGGIVGLDPFLRSLSRALARQNYERKLRLDGPREIPNCRDCSQRVEADGHGTPDGTYCDPCYRWRASRGLEFDARTKSMLVADEQQGAA